MMMHIYAMLAGLVLDWIVGDPEWFPHPVKFIGKYISWMEGILRRRFPEKLRTAAVWLTASTVVLTMAVTALMIWLI